MPPLLAIAGGAALVLAASTALGRFAWSFSAPHWTYALSSGVPLLSLCFFALLVTGKATHAAALALCAAAAALLLLRPPRPARPVLPHWSALAFLPFFAFYLIHALAPEIQPDAVTYHLGLVSDWIRNAALSHRIGFYDLLPLGLETIFFPAVVAGGFSAAKLVHFALLCATLPLIARLAQLFGLDRTQALAAAGLYFLSPVAGISGTAAYNDAALVFFSLAVLALLAEDAAQPHDSLLFHAGLAAGFCYAIKITGAVAVAGLLGWLLWKRRWRGALLASLAALLSVAPWMLRSLLLSGNPLAPLGNRLFPNDFFHAFNEEILARYLSDYGGLAWHRIPWTLAIDGSILQGLYGPLFLLLPLALFALRTPAGRALLGAALILALPWTRNIGARFFMPAFALLALSLVLVLPRRLAPVLLLLQALLCWPAVLDLYSSPNAWRLRGFPSDAALRIESEDHYLERSLPDYRFTRLAARQLRENEPLLDLTALPFAYLNTVPTGPLSSSQFDNIVQTLNTAYGAAPERLYPVRCRFPLTFARGIRIRLNEPLPGSWSISEVSVERHGAALPISRNWLLRASPEPGDAWLAIDGNRATRWSSLHDGKPGMSWELRFDRPTPIDGLSLILPNYPRTTIAAIEVENIPRRWIQVSRQAEIGTPWRVFYRHGAIRFLKREGFRWIAARLGADGHGPTAESLVALREAWGVELAVRQADLVLLRLR
ncbi:MAG: glycosyltransferase family 39 protein [Acidobacteria bacterium]|nr:glycosyltransferase family 39 protein [Acidobacteriota bacterium]